jgi:uncharacterized protein YggE
MKKLFATLAASALCISSFAQQTITIPAQTNKIEVTGSAEMEVIPDEIYTGITLQEYRKENKSKVSIDEISRNFISICEKAGISKDRIEVQNMSGFDQSEWYVRKRRKEQPDLMQSTTYTIKFSSPGEIDKLVNLLDDNATQNIYIIKTSSSHEKEYRRQLKVQALQNAKEKAQYMLEGIGSHPGNVVYVKEIENNAVIYPMYKMAGVMANSAMESNDSGANEGLNFHKVKYHYDVEAHFEIK